MTPSLPSAGRRPWRFGRLALAAFVAALSTHGLARAGDDDPPPEGAPPEGAEAVEKKVREQMQKIARLMRENQQALLDASRAGGSRPEGVDVKPPDLPPSPDAAGPSGSSRGSEGASGASGGTEGSPKGGAEGAGSGGGQAPPGGTGERARKSIDELIAGTRDAGGRIPKEIEELIRMIPLSGGGDGSGGGGSPPKPMPDSQTRKGREPGKGESTAKQDHPDDGGKEPRDPAKEPKQRDGEPPPPSRTGDAAETEVPPWDPSLPPEFRRAMSAADVEKVPPQYRALVERYQRWLQEHSKASPR